MKRGRGDTLTGGSRDVNPQTMLVQAIQLGPDVTNGQALALPIPRLPIAKGRSLVIELLRVKFIKLNPQNPAVTYSWYVSLTTNGTTPTSILNAQTDPKTLADWLQYNVAITAAGVQLVEGIKDINLTDDAGHGILVATDQIFLYILSVTTAITNGICARLEYRFKDVSLEEYIGIVQSQQ